MMRLQEILDEAKKEGISKLHHRLMQYYDCWIPIEIFRKTPIPTLVNIINWINEESKKQPKGKIPPKIMKRK